MDISDRKETADHVEIREQLPKFNHDSTSTLGALGIDAIKFTEKRNKIASQIFSPENDKPSKLMEMEEKIFTKRELLFLFHEALMRKR